MSLFVEYIYLGALALLLVLFLVLILAALWSQVMYISILASW